MFGGDREAPQLHVEGSDSVGHSENDQQRSARSLQLPHWLLGDLDWCDDDDLAPIIERLYIGPNSPGRYWSSIDRTHVSVDSGLEHWNDVHECLGGIGITRQQIQICIADLVLSFLLQSEWHAPLLSDPFHAQNPY